MGGIPFPMRMPMFTVHADPVAKILRTRLSGVFDVGEVMAFAMAAQAAVAGMRCASGDYRHVCDIADLKLQAGPVADAFDSFINHPSRRSRRLAIVTGEAAVKMQVRRMLNRSDARIVKTQSEADAWLAEPMPGA